MMKIITSQFIFPCQRLGILLGCNLLNLALVNPAMAQTELLRSLTVTGNGREEISTTIALVELGVEIRGKTATEVQREIASRTSALVDLLRDNNVERLQTTGIRLNPNYEPRDRNNNNEEVITGYIGTNTVSFRVATEVVGSLLDKAVEAGASRVDGISFTATPEAISIAKNEALRKATTDAQEQAEVVLDSLDLTPNEIVKIEVDEANVSQPRPYASDQFAVSESRISTPVIGGEQTVRAAVTLQISY